MSAQSTTRPARGGAAGPPREAVAVEDLPRAVLGKTLRRELREQSETMGVAR